MNIGNIIANSIISGDMTKGQSKLADKMIGYSFLAITVLLFICSITLNVKIRQHRRVMGRTSALKKESKQILIILIILGLSYLSRAVYDIILKENMEDKKDCEAYMYCKVLLLIIFDIIPISTIVYLHY